MFSKFLITSQVTDLANSSGRRVKLGVLLKCTSVISERKSVNKFDWRADLSLGSVRELQINAVFIAGEDVSW